MKIGDDEASLQATFSQSIDKLAQARYPVRTDGSSDHLEVGKAHSADATWLARGGAKERIRPFGGRPSPGNRGHPFSEGRRVVKHSLGYPLAFLLRSGSTTEPFFGGDRATERQEESR